MMNKKAIICALFMMFLFIPTVAADTVTLYANIDDSSSQCNILIDAMRSDSAYDPYNQYVVVRSGEYEYRIYFGKDLSGSDLVYYRYVTGSYGTQATMSRGTATSLTINNAGHYYVGNIPGSLSSAQAEQYKLGAIITVVGIIIVVVVLFKLFRKSEGRKTKYYSVR